MTTFVQVYGPKTDESTPDEDRAVGSVPVGAYEMWHKKGFDAVNQDELKAAYEADGIDMPDFTTSGDSSENTTAEQPASGQSASGQSTAGTPAQRTQETSNPPKTTSTGTAPAPADFTNK